MTYDTAIVVYEKKERKFKKHDIVINITDIINEIGDQERDNIIRKFRKADSNYTDSQLSIHISPMVITKRMQWTSLSLDLLVPLYIKILERIAENDIDHVDAREIYSPIDCLIQDIGDELEISVRVSSSGFSRLDKIKKITYSYFYIFSYCILSLATKNSKINRTPIFPVGDILKKIRSRSNLKLSHCTVQHPIRNFTNSDDADVRYNSIPVSVSHRFLSYFFYRGFLPLIGVKNELIDSVLREFSIEMTRTVNYIYYANVVPASKAGCYYQSIKYSSGDILAKSAIISSGDGHTGRAIAQGAIERDLRTYHLHHGLMTPRINVLNEHTVKFVSGPHEQSYAESSEQFEEIQSISTGHPKLDSFNHPVNLIKQDASKFTVMIATQSVYTQIINEFVETVIGTTNKSHNNFDIIIKPHPRENKNKYLQFCENRNVRLETGDIKNYLPDCDLLVTINSNSGIDSIAYGVPCVCYIQHKSLTPPMPYSEDSPVPIYECENELAEFFNSLKKETLNEIIKDERSFIRDNYLTDDVVYENIRKHINQVE
jgi:hypothetical protein